MARALPATNPHEMRLERGKRAFEAAAERSNARTRGGNHCRARGRVLEPSAGAQHETLGVVYFFGAVRGVERGVDLGEIPHVRAMQNCRAKLDRFDRILPAMARQR